MSKTRKIRRARKAVERAEALVAKTNSENEFLQMQKKRADAEALECRVKWGWVVEHLGSALQSEAVLSAIIHGPVSRKVSGGAHSSAVDPRRQGLPFDRDADLRALVFEQQVIQLRELVIQSSRGLSQHQFIIGHGPDNRRAIMLSDKALHSLPEEVLASDLHKALYEAILDVKG